MIDDATRRQIAAADPDRSTWLTANAGSGKTRVLTDRVSRLLLAGTPPERILCLTYTKAAAAEMQNRLLARLGRWAMLPEAELREELAQMGVAQAPDLPQARRLFARAIETPGGLKVQTIHAFCASLLRRFPLEAGVPVGFTELDERTDAQLRANIVEAMAEAGEPEVADLVGLHSGHKVEVFLDLLSRADSRLDTEEDVAALWRLAGLAHPHGPEELRAEVLAEADPALLAELARLMARGGVTDAGHARTLAGLDWDGDPLDLLARLEEVFLYGAKAKAPFGAKIGKVPTAATQKHAAHLIDDLHDLMTRIEGGRPRRAALAFAQRTTALRRFALRFTALYAAEKLRRGWLSFDDLIARTSALLSSASMAQWVLFRLDGGIDHILVDEAQDTSPDQWQVIERLAAEFTAGEGTRGGAAVRTLFVVGDPKQSIYSFQGADIAVFAGRKRGFGAAFDAVGQPMQDAMLEYSFRSSPVILSVVDQVFQGPAGEGLGDVPHHRAHRSTQPGRVDLWQPIEAPPKAEVLDWDARTHQDEVESEVAALARAMEARIAAMLGQPITDRHGVTRPIVPGDILILVQRRGTVFDAVIRALKAAGQAVAGADRMKLTAELAVRDIRALLSVLATPEDDLSLAAVLRSPLFDVDEVGLWRLAAGRGRAYLWEALRDARPGLAPGLAEARAVISDMLAASTHLRPHDLIARLLIRHGGRARLLARLGDEAADGIDELMSQALTYERGGVPTLTGFLVWLGEEELEVRRPPDPGEAGGTIRVMTVHGAKGLESPIVILPDTACRNPPQPSPVLPMPQGPAVIRPKADEQPPAIAAIVAELAAKQEEERRRLLYVAMTRAESWLIVAAAGKTGEATDSWHAMVADGVARTTRLGLARHETIAADDGPPIERLSFGDWPEVAVPVAAAVPDVPSVALPDWLTRPAPPADRPLRTRAATSLGGAKVVGGPLPVDAEVSAEDAMLAGTRLHLLLEHLPGLAEGDRAERARALMAGSEGGLPDDATLAALLEQAAALIDAPDLAAVFAPAPGERVLAEVPLMAALPGVGPITGTVDRLIVGPERVLAIDYKSNTLVPTGPEAVPLGILRQMAAYRDALRLIWPGRAVEVAVLWTRTGQLMVLPDAGLDPVLGGNPAMT